MINEKRLAIVVPVYNEAIHLPKVLASVPTCIDVIVVVDDASTDDSVTVARRIAETDKRIIVKTRQVNGGVGAASVDGFLESFRLGADIAVKVDGDDQMPLEYLNGLVKPLVDERADFSKGNRFSDRSIFSAMPIVRLIGNSVLTLLVKAASGYWDVVDPTNGYLAISKKAFENIDHLSLNQGYFFESSLLCELYMANAVVEDVPIPARYGEETSHLSVTKSIFTFPFMLVQKTVRRFFRIYFAYDMSIASFYFLMALVLNSVGLGFGCLRWYQYATVGQPAPTGTIVLPAMAIIIGIQFLIAGLDLDVKNQPRVPLCKKKTDR